MDAAEKNHELYERLREDLLRRQLSNAENLDRAILTLSSAALAVSFAWVNSRREYCCVPVLLTAWGMLLAALAATLCSFFVSQAGIRVQLEASERYFLKNDDSAFNAGRPYDIWNTALAHAAAALFGIGILLLVLFAASNLSRKEIGMDSENLSAVGDPSIKGGAPITNMQNRVTEERAAPITPMPQRVQQQPANSTSGQSADGNPKK